MSGKWLYTWLEIRCSLCSCLQTRLHLILLYLPVLSRLAVALLLCSSDAVLFDYEMHSAASDVLCAAFNESNGVYMADSGTHLLFFEASAVTDSAHRSSH